MNEELQPLTEHLGELRRRIIWVLLTFMIGLIVSFIYASDLFHFIMKDATGPDIEINALSPGDPLMVYVQIAFICSVVFTLPVILYHLWQFVRPGLKENEQKNIIIYIPVAFFLFIGGLAFGYYLVFPLIISFLDTLSAQMGVKQMYGIYQYFDFMINVIIPIAVLFELPVIVLFLTKIRIITPQLLHKIRKVAYFSLVVVSTLIAPPTIVANIMIAIPLIILYEVSVLLSIWQYRKLEIKDAQIEDEQDQDDVSDAS